jgi:hypothetical protein
MANHQGLASMNEWSETAHQRPMASVYSLLIFGIAL